MAAKDWIQQKDKFLTIDLREVTVDMVGAVTTRAKAVPVGNGLHLIDAQEPTEFIEPLRGMGFDYEGIRVSDQEFHGYFFRPAEGP